MKTKLIFPFSLAAVAAVTGFFLSSCGNPAEGIPAAEEVTGEVTPAPEGKGQVYVFTPESKIEFVGSKVTGSHEGGFETFTGQFKTDGDQLLRGDNYIEIDMTSTWSDNEKLTGHLRSDDFFDVENHPTARFDLIRSDDASGADEYELVGDFTLRGVTKTIRFPVKASKDGDQGRLTSEFVINRKDYGIVYPGKPDDLIRDEVVIKLDLVAEPKA